MNGNNFRITTDYILELLDVLSGNYYTVWLCGQAGAVQLRVALEPDETGVALEIDPRFFPSGNENSNYRVKQGLLQLLNVDTGLFHTIFITGVGNSIAISISQEGEN